MSQTFTNPDNPDQTYTVGQRGRKPSWVLPMLAEAGIKPATKTYAKAEKKEEPSLMAWSLDGKCIIVAKTPSQAVLMFNKTTSHPLSGKEMDAFWTRLKNLPDLGVGVWIRKDEEWMKREEKPV
jgi:hypothetical protein